MSEKIYPELREYLSKRGYKNFDNEVYLNILNGDIDFVCEKDTPKGQHTRRYIFELKEKDFDKVIDQALQRMYFCDYISVIMVNTDLSYFCHKFVQNFEEIKEEGIGVYYYKKGNFNRIRKPKLQNGSENVKTLYWDKIN